MPAEEIVVLANSLKVGGRCVAGISTRSDQWVRPVSNTGEGELYPVHTGMPRGEPRALDIVQFSYTRPSGDPAQPENVDLDEESDWVLTGRLDLSEAEEALSRHLAAGPNLFGDRDGSIAEVEAGEGVEASLALIEPLDLSFELRHPWRPGAKPGFRARFSLLDDAWYDLSLTDDAVRSRLKRREYGIYRPADLGYEASRVFLTASLGGAFRGRCWKLAAAVLFLP